MSLIQRLHASKPGAPSQIAATAADARKLGFRNVETHYEPATREHTVTGDLPPEKAQRTLDRILGR
ncbi:hypothetical protein ACWGB8_01795 [Kitasatospora sp. NPDC054939]